MDGSASPTPSSSSQGGDRGAPTPSEFHPERIQEMHETKQELVLKVQGLKRELADWRARMDGQVKTYRSELGELQATLSSEMGALRSELQDMKARIRKQLAANGELIRGMQARGDPATQQLAAVALAAPVPAKPRAGVQAA